MRGFENFGQLGLASTSTVRISDLFLQHSSGHTPAFVVVFLLTVAPFLASNEYKATFISSLLKL